MGEGPYPNAGGSFHDPQPGSAVISVKIVVPNPSRRLAARGIDGTVSTRLLAARGGQRPGVRASATVSATSDSTASARAITPGIRRKPWINPS